MSYLHFKIVFIYLSFKYQYVNFGLEIAFLVKLKNNKGFNYD